ncbi:hypothetical protein ACWDOP_13895 [Nocardia sp. NPDC003693]
MAVRLAWGVVADRTLGAWSAETGEPVDPRAHDLRVGAAVVLGDRDSAPERVAAARNTLARWMAAGGPVIAGAGIDLGDGFVSARLAGATGDRRDAVLAALRVLGIEGAGRLGARASTLVALFGVSATKPVGAAAEQAIREQRWAALTLASAAAELLGPEQVAEVLGWPAPAGTDPIPAGAPSALAANLTPVLNRYPRQRRRALLRDLWDRVGARQATLALAESRIRAQDMSRAESLYRRRRQYDADLTVAALGLDPTDPLALLTAIRRVPVFAEVWKPVLERLIQDAVAATVLVRLAVAVHEHGAVAGVTALRPQLAAASALVGRHDVKSARRDAPAECPLPARPICHVRDIDSWLRQQQPMNRAFEKFVRVRTATALAYATVVEQAFQLTLREMTELLPGSHWDSPALREWRAAVGYVGTRAPATWDMNPYVAGFAETPLARRLEQDPAAREHASDLLWYGELADTVVSLRGHRAAEIRTGYGCVPHFDPDPAAERPEPLTPRLDSIPLAVAGAAQLVALGATPPARCPDWASLCAGLMTGGAVAAALGGEFEVPETILDLDGQRLPGTDARVQVARDTGRLAEWSDYMGNCIAGYPYRDEAMAGRSVLLALRDAQDTILVNAELRSTGYGWWISEVKGRFNDDPDPVLKTALERLVRELRRVEPDTEPETPAPESGVRPRRSAPDAVRELGPALRAVVCEPVRDVAAARAVFIALADAPVAGTGVSIGSKRAGGQNNPPAPVEHRRPVSAATDTRRGTVTRASAGRREPGFDAEAAGKALTVLRRANPERLAGHVRTALSGGLLTLPQLWAASGARPLTRAVERLDPDLIARHPRVRRLSDDTALPSKALRRLVRDPDIGTARSIELVALRLRAALYALARADDPVFARALIRDPRAEFLCPLILALTTTPPECRTIAVAAPGKVTVPGFPATTLDDPAGPWQRGWPTAVALGASAELFWAHVADTGLRVPASWLPGGGWNALWGRAGVHPIPWPPSAPDDVHVGTLGTG